MEKKQAYQVIVIGAGPAGLMAAGQAAGLGARTLILEKMEQAGAKLRITGKGRCNITNIAGQEEFIAHFGREGQFLRQAFARFYNQDLLDFMNAIGVQTTTERGGRVFPVEGDANQVTQKINLWAASQGAEMQIAVPVQHIITNHTVVTGIETRTGQFIPAGQVVLATGGASFSHTGSSGDGFRMANEIGHTIVPLRPALVPLKTAGNLCQRMQGLSLRNVEVTVAFDGKSILKDFGELLFTHFGISGPVILSMSGQIVDALISKKKVEIFINLKPGLDEKKLETRILRDLDEHGKQQFGNMLEGLLPRKMVPVMADVCGIPLNKPCHQISAEERSRLLHWLREFHVEVSGHLPLDSAMVTAGGISLKEIDPRTMASRLVEGLYCCGEALDLDGDTGGYNLQAAFSTGYVAGEQAAFTSLNP